jgi:hypothetical protein
MGYYNYQISHPHSSSSTTDYYTTTTTITTITTNQSLNQPLLSSLYMTYIPAAYKYKEISIT